MYSHVTLPTILLSSLFLASGSMAMDKVLARSILTGRQSQAFQPGSDHGQGATCADAFGAGFIQCGTGTKCYNPTGGESCCQATYPCPQGSFCLIDGYCCPDGIDPAMCALNNGVTLPPGFTTGAPAAPSGASSAAPSSAAASPTSVYVAPSSAANYSIIATGAPSAKTSGLAVFTGAASPQHVAGGAVVVLGLLGVVGNVL